MTAPSSTEHRKNDKRTSGPRFTSEELALIRKAAEIEDRAVSNLIRVATMQYARAVVRREG